MAQQNYTPVTRCQAITDVIESVAMQEKALAKILKDVDEKPKDDKAHYDSDYKDCSYPYPETDYDKDKKKEKKDELDVINAVTRLEFLLTAKLYLFADCACPKDGCKDHEKTTGK